MMTHPNTVAAQPPRPARQHHPADRAELDDALARYASFPEWLRSVLESHLTNRWHQWKPHMAAENAHGTSRQLVTAWQWLCADIRPQGWDELRRTHIEAWMDDCLSRGLKAATVARYRTHLVSVLLLCTRARYCRTPSSTLPCPTTIGAGCLATTPE